MWNGSNQTTMDRGLNIPSVSVTMMDEDDDGLGLDLLDDMDLGMTEKSEGEKILSDTPLD